MNEAYNKMKYFEETEGIKRKVYYHYTSLDALYSIVQSHTFRLMSLKSSNDRLELYYKPKNLLEDISKLRDEEENSDFKGYYELVIQAIKEHKTSYFELLKSSTCPYALCLASKRDNLTHWDRYANNCKGVCIAFNVAALDVLYKRTDMQNFSSIYFDVGTAIYSSDEIRTIIKNSIIKDDTPAFIEVLKSNDDTYKKYLKEFLLIALYNPYSYIMKFAKDYSFIDEDEIRLYHDAYMQEKVLQMIESLKKENLTAANMDITDIKEKLAKFDKIIGINKENFIMTKSGNRSYRNLCLSEVWGSGTIPEIIIGPQCVQNHQELEHFLMCNGLEGTKVSISKVPIR